MSLMNTPSIAIAIVARPREAQEWQALLQAASWRRHLGGRVNIHLFTPHGGQDRLAKRTLAACSALQCAVHPAALSERHLHDFLDAAAIGAHSFEEDLVVICRPGLLVTQAFDIAPWFSGGQPVAALASPDAGSSPKAAAEAWAGTLHWLGSLPLEPSAAAATPCVAGLLAFNTRSSLQRFFSATQHAVATWASRPDATALAPWLPAAVCQGLGEGLRTLPASLFGATPREGVGHEAKIVLYQGSQDLYQSGLNRYASSVLAESGSGFKNLLDLLQRESAPAPTPHTPQAPAIIAEPPRLGQPFAEWVQASEAIKGLRPFVIVGAMRTGSNLLQDYLNQCGGMKCHGELFNPSFINGPDRRHLYGVTVAERDADPAQLLIKILEHREQATAIGFRFFDKHLEAGLEEWMKLPQLSIVTLTRDPLESFISLQNALTTNQWLLRKDSERKTAQWTFEPAQFMQYCKVKLEFYKRHLMRAKCLGLPNFHLRYQDFDHPEVLLGLCTYLRVTPPPQGFRQNIIKQINCEARDIIINHEVVAPTVERARLAFPQLDWNTDGMHSH